MTPIVLVDGIEFAAAAAGLFYLLWGWRRTSLSFEVKFFLGAILLFKFYHGFSNVLQWGGITLALDEWEDLLEVLVPGFWAVTLIFYGISRSEQEAKESEKSLRVIYDSIKDMIVASEFSHEKVPGRIVDANDTVLEKLGYTREELLDLEVDQLEVPERAAAGRGFRARTLAEKGQVIFETALRRKGEAPAMEVEVNAHLVEVGGRLINLSVIRDVTDRKKTEAILRQAKEDLERQNEELRSLDRMKDALISDISHELKTPVAKHAMQMEVLRNLLGRHDVIHKVEDVIGIIEEGIRRQQSVIRNILLMSRLEAGGREFSRERVRLGELLQRITDEYVHAIAAYGIRLETEFAPFEVKTDEEMVWHVFSNVISNAIKYRSREHPWIRIAMDSRNGRGWVTVTDNGVGLTEEERERAFDRFYQASPAVEGIGLGLHISRMILEKTGGSIELESEGRDRGTTIQISFPLA